MKKCQICQTQLDDNALFCTTCGSQALEAVQQEQPVQQPVQPEPATQQLKQEPVQQQQYSGYQAPPQGGIPTPPPTYTPVPSPYDHTGEFDAKDISDNKVISMLVYLMGPIGILIALLASGTSPYASFHVRQSLKFTVIEILSALVTLILCWTIIVPIAYGIFMAVLFVVKIICFFQICSGKAIEPVIVRSLGFLR